jgi:hypothetical protein
METMDNIHALSGCRTVGCVRMAVPGSEICTRCQVKSRTETLNLKPNNCKIFDIKSGKRK